MRGEMDEHFEAGRDSERDLNPGRGPLGRQLIAEGAGVGGQGSANNGDDGDDGLPTAIEEFRRDFSISERVAEEMFDWLIEKGLLHSRKDHAFADIKGLEVLMHIKGIFQDIWEQEPNVKNYCRFRALNLPWLDDLMAGPEGLMNPTEFARALCGKKIGGKKIINQTKQNVNKEYMAAKERLSRLGITLSPRKGERGDGSREKMRAARLKQINGNPKAEGRNPKCE